MICKFVKKRVVSFIDRPRKILPLDYVKRIGLWKQGYLTRILKGFKLLGKSKKGFTRRVRKITEEGPALSAKLKRNDHD